MRSINRRNFLWTALCASTLLAQTSKPSSILREQIGGEWCFVKFPKEKNRNEAVLILHGAGEWVDANTSSWESQPGATTLMQALLDDGYTVAQSNGAARHNNGMWGNSDAQTATANLAEWVTKHSHPHKFHALAMSAGNLVLMNLLLDGRMQFDSAVMLAPCLSIASEYRCPGGIDRVKSIAEAYHFTPGTTCPGEPEHDNAFITATAASDPMKRLQRLSDEQLRSALSKTRLFAAYESDDPRVPPAENILAFSQKLQHAGIPLTLNRMEAKTHGSQELFLRFTPEIVAFL